MRATNPHAVRLANLWQEVDPLGRTSNCRKPERVTGIEPAFSAWEADVLPLNYTRETTLILANPGQRPAAFPATVPPPSP